MGGLGWIGLVWIGLDWFELVWIGLDWVGLGWTGFDWVESINFCIFLFSYEDNLQFELKQPLLLLYYFEDNLKFEFRKMTLTFRFSYIGFNLLKILKRTLFPII